MLVLLDILLTCSHLLVIAINLFGWIWQRTRKLHLYTVLITVFCWLILGFWYGFGYCSLTDWQWSVKQQLGQAHLPASFIKYFIDTVFKTDVNSGWVDIFTVSGFALAIILAGYYFFKSRQNATSS